MFPRRLVELGHSDLAPPLATAKRERKQTDAGHQRGHQDRHESIGR